MGENVMKILPFPSFQDREIVDVGIAVQYVQRIQVCVAVLPLQQPRTEHMLQFAVGMKEKDTNDIKHMSEGTKGHENDMSKHVVNVEMVHTDLRNFVIE